MTSSIARAGKVPHLPRLHVIQLVDGPTGATIGGPIGGPRAGPRADLPGGLTDRPIRDSLAGPIGDSTGEPTGAKNGDPLGDPTGATNGASLAGPPGDLPLVLLHGFTGDHSTWARLVPHLGSSRAVFAVDLVGHGASEAPDDPAAYTMPVAVAAVRAAARACGIARAHWLGYSMGGRVALNLALDAPDMVATLVLVGASPGIADEAARAARVREDEALADRIERDGLAAFVDAWMANPLFATQARLGEDYLVAARAQRLRQDPRALALTLRGMGTGAMPPVWDRLAELCAPVLLVSGAIDTRFGALGSAMAARLPRAETVCLPDCGHAAHVESPAVLAEAVRAFLLRADDV